MGILTSSRTIAEEMDFDESYDLVVIGTGLVESILSCAAAKSGKKVLHLDSVDFYGSQDASNDLNTFVSDLRNKADCNEYSRVFVVEEYISTDNKSELICSDSPCIVDEGSNDLKQDLTWNDLLLISRQFNIDYQPRVIEAGGSLVKALVDSGVAKYLEFQSVDGIYYYQNGGDLCRPWNIPFTKGDIFASKNLEIMEKRSLMKFQHHVCDCAWEKDGMSVVNLNDTQLGYGRSLQRPQNKTNSLSGTLFGSTQELLDNFKLSSKLRSIIIHVLCLRGDPDVQQTSEPWLLDTVANLANALERFAGKGFLLPQYGNSEIIQGFCRSSAVWGTTFALRTTVASLDIAHDPVSDERVIIRLTDNNCIRANAVVVNVRNSVIIPTVSLLPCYDLHSTLFLRRPLAPEGRSMFVIPAAFEARRSDGTILKLENSFAIYLQCIDCSTSCCPEGIYIVRIRSRILDLVSKDRIDLDSWTTRAAANATSALELIRKIMEIVFINQENTSTLYRETYLSPVFDDVVGDIQGLFPVGGNGTFSFGSDHAVDEAAKVWNGLFGFEQLFQESEEGCDRESQNDDENDDLIENRELSMILQSDVSQETDNH